MFGDNVVDGRIRCPVEIWDEETIRAGAAYAADYIDRYRDQALLHVDWEGKSRPVVALKIFQLSVVQEV